MPPTHTNRPVFGVDFGMSTSSLAILSPDGSTQLVTDPGLPPGSQHAIPTAVCLADSGPTLLVGSAAVNARNRRPEAYRDNFKLDVKVDAPPVSLAGQPFKVVDLVTAVLAFLRERAREIDPRDPSATVLTVPVRWAKGRKQILIRAATKAGFPPASLFTYQEPIAAAEYARSLDAVAEDGTLLVYDLGGGTFDCAVVTPTTVLQPGVRHADSLEIGGHLFDRRLRDELGRRFPDQVGPLLHGEPTGANRWRLMHLLETCESMKIRLSESDRVHEPLTELAQPVDAEVTRAEFEGLIRDPIEQTMDCCLKMLGRIGLTWEQVNAVVPVGGSSRIPLVQGDLEYRARDRVLVIEERDSAVVRGAALLARKRADHILEARGPSSQELTPPDAWAAPAVPDQPDISDARRFLPFSRGWLGGIWGTLIPAYGAAVTLAAWHWGPFGTSVLGALALLAVVGAAWLTATKERGSLATSVLLLSATSVMTVILIVVAAKLGYRTIVEHQPGGPVAWWALGAGVAGLVAFVTQVLWSTDASDARRSQAGAQQDTAITAQVSGRTWFGPTENPPDFMQPLFDLPALRGCDLSGTAKVAGLNYALVAGSRVLFVAMLTSADDRPDLDAAVASWRQRLDPGGTQVLIKTILVVPGYELPALTASENFRMTAPMTTTQAFADTVGHWLDQDNRISVRVMRALLSGLAEQRARAAARPPDRAGTGG
jgi:actin-like ATPase involved in cell morphogenesis